MREGTLVGSVYSKIAYILWNLKITERLMSTNNVEVIVWGNRPIFAGDKT